MDQKNLEERNFIIAMKQNHKNELLRRCPQMEDRMQVWELNDLIYLPCGSGKEIFEEIRLKVLELAESIKR